MDNVKVELPLGYSAQIKPFLNFGQKRQLQKLMAGAMSINPEKGSTDTTLNGSIVYEAQDFTLKMMLVSLTKPDGNVLSGVDAYNAVQEFNGESETVGAAIYEKIDEITKSTYLSDEGKKK